MSGSVIMVSVYLVGTHVMATMTVMMLRMSPILHAVSTHNVASYLNIIVLYHVKVYVCDSATLVILIKPESIISR